ncbi:2-oxo acid dehydrogenase subunit E2 [Glutamicibacter nicotianae]
MSSTTISSAPRRQISFTHLIGFAVIRALKQIPSMNVTYTCRRTDRDPSGSRELRIAIDMPKPDGTRMLAVPNIKAAETLSFNEFWATYEDLIKRARGNKLTADDYAGTTVSLTNPGGIGTVHSVPRLSRARPRSSALARTGIPAEYRGSSRRPWPAWHRQAHHPDLHLRPPRHPGCRFGRVPEAGRVAAAGRAGLLRLIFEQLRIPYEPVRWPSTTSRHRPAGQQGRPHPAPDQFLPRARP